MKKIPIRKCVGCNENKLKKELIRIVRNKEGEVSIDFTGKANGRGVYICNDVACLEKAKKSKRISRALNAEIPDEIYEKLLTELKDNG